MQYLSSRVIRVSNYHLLFIITNPHVIVRLINISNITEKHCRYMVIANIAKGRGQNFRPGGRGHGYKEREYLYGGTVVWGRSH